MDFRYKLTLVFTVITILGFGQKPKIMIIPSDALCISRGAYESVDVDGRMEKFSDYKKLLQEESNKDIRSVITKIQDIYSSPDVSYPLVDLKGNIDKASLDGAKKLVAGRYESQLLKLISVAKPDIILELEFSVESVPNSSKKYLKFNIKSRDAYSMKVFGAKDGKTDDAQPNIPNDVLLEEAVQKYIEELNVSIMNHFQDIQENGIEITVQIQTDDNSSYKLTDEIEINGKSMTLQRVFKAVVNNLDHVNNNTPTCTGDGGEYICDQVRMPKTYIDDVFGEELKMTAIDFGTQVSDMMMEKFKIKTLPNSLGLGIVTVLVK